MRTPIATPPLMARRHSADRRHNDLYAGVMDTARAARHRSSRVGRRAETHPKPTKRLKKSRQKGDGGTFGPAFPPIIDAPQAPVITAARPSSPLRTHTSDVTTTIRGAGRSSRQCAAKRKSRAMRDFGLQYGETRTRTGDTTISVVDRNRSNRVESPAISGFTSSTSGQTKSAICILLADSGTGAHLGA